MVIIKETPYKMAGRMYHIEDSLISVGGHNSEKVIFGEKFQIIGGPCTIENRKQMLETAKSVKASGATVLRGGAFKPRTSPYSFQGLGEEGLKYLSEAKALTGLPTVSEIMDSSQLAMFEDVDILQVGSKNMQNFSLLKALAKSNKPILLKHSFGCTLEEFLLSAEYILANGNPNVILCERGIRTFETATRFSLDLSLIPLIRELSHLPIIVDPSHSSGISSLVKPVSKAATVIGAQGLMIEVHDNPCEALCDGPQAVSYKNFENIVKSCEELLPFAHQTKNPFLGN